MHIPIEIPDRIINDEIITALDGAIAYWTRSVKWFDTGFDTDAKRLVSQPDDPLAKLSKIVIVDCIDREHILQISGVGGVPIEKGLQVMAKKYPETFGALIAGNGDSVTADVFIQCCIFGEVTYG